LKKINFMFLSNTFAFNYFFSKKLLNDAMKLLYESNINVLVDHFYSKLISKVFIAYF